MMPRSRSTITIHVSCIMTSRPTDSSASRPKIVLRGRSNLCIAFGVGCIARVSRRHEHIADTAHGLDDAGLRGIVFNQLAQAPDRDVDTALRHVRVRAVPEGEQPRTR